jgi:hypothetical protein
VEYHSHPQIHDFDGANVGDHPLVKRLMRGVFKERPSRRANPMLWDPLKVLDIFQHGPLDLSHSKLMRKGGLSNGPCHRQEGS